MLANGLALVADLAARSAGCPVALRRRKALILGSLREDVLLLPWGRVTEYPSFSHFYHPALPGGFLPFLWPGPRSSAGRLHRRARALAARGDEAGAYVLLGRIMHLLADMGIPSHAHRVPHERDPFEWYVEAHVASLRDLPVPHVASAPPAVLVESLARCCAAYAPDPTNFPLGRWMRRHGLVRKPSADEIAAQARALIPLAAGHGAALLRGFAA